MFNIVEIFDSIEGEGVRTGQLATFVRLAGCNLRCSYCDTPYAHSFGIGDSMTTEDIISKLITIGNKNVTITGGEPLGRPGIVDLVKALVERGFEVNIETNGSKELDKFFEDSFDVIVTMDYKLPSSGMEESMCLENFDKLQNKDVLKFVVGSEEDLTSIKYILENRYKNYVNIYLSPIFGSMDPKRLVEFAKELRHMEFSNVTVQVQLHKIIWPVDMRGV